MKHQATARDNGSTYRSVEELAEELGLGRQSVYAGLRTGIIPGIRIGKRFVLPRVAITNWLANSGNAGPRRMA